jgi:hypothetical protein
LYLAQPLRRVTSIAATIGGRLLKERLQVLAKDEMPNLSVASE